MAESGIAIYTVGCWFSVFTRDTTWRYATQKATNPSKMFIAPAGHETFGLSVRPPGPYWGYFGINVAEVHKGYNNERLRFFDHYLKGIESGIDKEPPIYIYVMNGDGWRLENEWPLGRQAITNYYFAEGNTLAKDKTSNGSDNYKVDLTLKNLQSRWTNGIAALKEIVKRTDLDPKCLTYTSEPLEQDVEVTGHPIVHFWVSSTANDGDFFVYLEDVDDKGEALFVTDGLLRANFAKLIPYDFLPPGSQMSVLPDLPWHGFKQSDYVDGIFAGGNKVELVIDLLPTSWVFKKGHRIRVSIAGADWPTLRLHPKLSPNNKPDDPGNIVPTITVYRDADHPSRIDLPVIPQKPILFEGTAKVRTSDGTYKGQAELYAFTDAVYLRYENQWMKWGSCEHREGKSLESFECSGDFGKLRATIRHKKDDSYVTSADGHGVSFKGTAK